MVELNGGLYVGEIGTLDSGSSEGGFVWFGDKSNCRSQHFEPSKKESTFPMEFVGEAGGLNGQVRVILATVEPKSDGLWYHGSMGSNFQLPSKVVAMGAMMSSFSKEDSEWKHVPVRSFLNKKEVLLGLIGLHKGELVRNECCEEFSIESCDVKLDTYSCEEVVLSRGQVHRKVPAQRYERARRVVTGPSARLRERAESGQRALVRIILHNDNKKDESRRGSRIVSLVRHHNCGSSPAPVQHVLNITP